MLPRSLIVRQSFGSKEYLESIAMVVNTEPSRTLRVRTAKAILKHEACRQSRASRANNESQEITHWTHEWSHKMYQEALNLKDIFKISPIRLLQSISH